MSAFIPASTIGIQFGSRSIASEFQELTEFLMKRTEPSPIAKLAPPGRKLEADEPTIEPLWSQGPGRMVMSAPWKFMGQNVGIVPLPRSDSAHQPCVLQAQPPARLQGPGNEVLRFAWALSPNMNVMVKPSVMLAKVTGLWNGSLLNQVGPPTSGNICRH